MHKLEARMSDQHVAFMSYKQIIILCTFDWVSPTPGQMLALTVLLFADQESNETEEIFPFFLHFSMNGDLHENSLGEFPKHCLHAERKRWQCHLSQMIAGHKLRVLQSYHMLTQELKVCRLFSWVCKLTPELRVWTQVVVTCKKKSVDGLLVMTFCVCVFVCARACV